jgi:6-pyruvoyltetrahydropterin/6-carboxytetrahydropterin synthase
MHEIFKEFTFEAAHRVPQFSGIHGHTFMVEVVLTGKPDPVYGWVISMTDLERPIEEVRKQLDHKYLNEVAGLEVPSIENIAKFIWDRLEAKLPGLTSVKIRRGAPGHGEGCTYRRAAA